MVENDVVLESCETGRALNYGSRIFIIQLLQWLRSVARGCCLTVAGVEVEVLGWVHVAVKGVGNVIPPPAVVQGGGSGVLEVQARGTLVTRHARERDAGFNGFNFLRGRGYVGMVVTWV